MANDDEKNPTKMTPSNEVDCATSLPQKLPYVFGSSTPRDLSYLLKLPFGLRIYDAKMTRSRQSREEELRLIRRYISDARCSSASPSRRRSRSSARRRGRSADGRRNIQAANIDYDAGDLSNDAADYVFGSSTPRQLSYLISIPTPLRVYDVELSPHLRCRRRRKRRSPTDGGVDVEWVPPVSRSAEFSPIRSQMRTTRLAAENDAQGAGVASGTSSSDYKLTRPMLHLNNKTNKLPNNFQPNLISNDDKQANITGVNGELDLAECHRIEPDESPCSTSSTVIHCLEQMNAQETGSKPGDGGRVGDEELERKIVRSLQIKKSSQDAVFMVSETVSQSADSSIGGNVCKSNGHSIGDIGTETHLHMCTVTTHGDQSPRFEYATTQSIVLSNDSTPFAQQAIAGSKVDVKTAGHQNVPKLN